MARFTTRRFHHAVDLVDELRLMVFPVALGSGRRLFPDTTRKAAWQLAGTLTFPTGVVVLTYRPPRG